MSHMASDVAWVSIHAPREGERRDARPDGQEKEVSIHAPREGERLASHKNFRLQTVSIHAPREGERHCGAGQGVVVIAFQSTLPARGSDDIRLTLCQAMPLFQSTLPARGSDHPPCL